MDNDDPIVAVALLTRSELALLGHEFRRAYAIEDAHSFADLLDAIDAAERQAGVSPRT